MMQLAGINHVQAPLADIVKRGQDLLIKRIHALAIPLVTREIQIHMLPNQAVGYARKTSEWIFNSIAEQLFAKHLVINRHAQREFRVCARTSIPELEVVLPAGEEELPLQVSHFYQLGAGLLLHARVFERHKERG